jgi:hypothetical protein
MAGLPAHSIRVGGFEYEFNLLPVEDGHPLRWELIALLGESLMGSLGSLMTGKSVADLEVDKLLGGLSGLFARLDPKFVLRAQLTFIRQTRYRAPGGQFVDLSATWQVHFAGRYHELDQLTFAHLRANYLSFLDDSPVWQALSRAGLQVLSAAQSRSTSPSTGISGASSVASGTA